MSDSTIPHEGFNYVHGHCYGFDATELEECFCGVWRTVHVGAAEREAMKILSRC